LGDELGEVEKNEQGWIGGAGKGEGRQKRGVEGQTAEQKFWLLA